MDEILSIQNLTKIYKKIPVVKNVNISLKKGHIYGLIGPNGAGKTTIMRILAGLTQENSGVLEFFGERQNLDAMRKRMSFMIEEPYIDKSMTASANMKYVRYLKGVADESRIDSMLKFVGLDKVEHKQVRHFSLGMRQRLGIAMALLSDPEILILDEPINGLDPEGIVDVRNMLKKLALEQGKTILISSHLLSELSELCTDFILINKGQVVDEMTKEELRTKCRSSITCATDDMAGTAAYLELQLGLKDYKIDHNGEMHIYERLSELPIISKTITDGGFVLTKLIMEEDNLEEYYLSKVGGKNE